MSRTRKSPRSRPKRVTTVARNPALCTPMLILDTATVAKRYLAFREAMPLIDVFYAVKANPHPAVLATLHQLGSHFDIASAAELSACVAAGANPAKLSYANTVKKSADVAAAAGAGVTLFAADTAAEVAKIARHAPGASVFIRLEMGGDGSALPLGAKFGTTVDEAVALLRTAAESGLDPHGVSFHVGSQQYTPLAYTYGLGLCAEVISALAGDGIALRLVDIGGGFPANGYTRAAPDIGDFAGAINTAISNLLDTNAVRVTAEPGRFLVADAGWMVGEVIADHVRDTLAGPQRWVTVDSGIYQGFGEGADGSIEYAVAPATGAKRPRTEAFLAGPTCDSIDVFHGSRPVLLPVMEAGERIIIASAGAYTAATAAVGFNGFDPPDVVVI